MAAVSFALLIMAGLSPGVATGEERVQNYSRQEIVPLDPGESYVFTLHSGATRTLKLVSFTEHRDSVIKRVRSAEVVVTVDGRELTLHCAPYVMPVVCDGLRLSADATSGFWPRQAKAVQLSLLDATDPIVDTARFGFPLANFALHTAGIQDFNEHAWQNLKTDGPGSPLNYHNYGIDLTGYEGRDEVRAAISGRILGTWTEIAENWDPGSIVILGDDGFWWEYAHLDRPAPGITKDARIEKGALVGYVGTRGPYGRNPNMHLGTYFVTGPKRWNINRTLNLYPWLVTAYEAEYHQGLYAVAGGHQVLFTDETATFDGSNSLSFDSEISTYEWRFSDGTSAAGRTVEKAFATPGIYCATLIATDRAGKHDAGFCEVKVYPRENPAPLARIVLSAYPSRGAKPGETVFVRGWIQGEVPEPIVIDFGDGSPAVECKSKEELTHVYRQPGLYVVTGRVPNSPHPITRQIKVIVAPAGT